MKIQLKFKNIVDTPKCKIFLGDQELYSGVVPPDYDRICELAEGDCQLIVKHFDKLPSDTIVENGAIVRDRSFELDKIIIDDYDLEELIWNSEFLAEDGSVYPSCLFFGPNGKFVLNFHNPILYWILKTRHEKNNNDPNWEEDYNYYQRACKILAQM